MAVNHKVASSSLVGGANIGNATLLYNRPEQDCLSSCELSRQKELTVVYGTIDEDPNRAGGQRLDRLFNDIKPRLNYWA